MGCTESVPIAPQQKQYSNNQQYLPSNPTLPSAQYQQSYQAPPQSYYSQPQYQQKYYATAQMYPQQYVQPQQYAQPQQYVQPQQYAQTQYYTQQPNYVPQQYYVQPQVQNQRPSTMNTVAAVAGGVILGDMISDMIDPCD